LGDEDCLAAFASLRLAFRLANALCRRCSFRLPIVLTVLSRKAAFSRAAEAIALKQHRLARNS